MKKSFILKSLLVMLLALTLLFAMVGCGEEEDLADKTALNEEIALEITSQGDYTDATYNTYKAKLSEAKAISENSEADQASVDAAAAALKSAREALALREVLAVDGKDKAISMMPGDTVEITLSDYINTNGLSKITYKAKTSNAVVSLEIIDGKLKITAGGIRKTTDLTVTIYTYYDNVEKLKTELSLHIAENEAPTLISGSVLREYDLLSLENKEAIRVDFSENINNKSGIALTYTATLGGESITLDGSRYTLTLGSDYTEQYVNTSFTVTVSYVANGVPGSVEYTYTVAVRDTNIYGLYNGGFENGLDGWTLVGNIGNVSSDKAYWVNEWENGGLGYQFGMDGDYMFSAYAEGAYEAAVGTLTSSAFTVGGSGFVTFKLGAMKDGNYVYVDVVDNETKQILARYYNGLWAEQTEGVKSGCTLISYKADLSEFIGKEVFFRVSDNADSGYGLFFLDSFVTYYENEPQGFNEATPVNYAVGGTIYDLFNGGFELGDVMGWWNNGEAGMVTNADAFFSGVAYGKDGMYLYSGVEDLGAGNGREGNVGTLTSSAFLLGGNGYITYMLGGGNSLCYLEIIDAVSGEVLARYRQQQRNDAVLVKYVADLSDYIGRTLRIRLTDNATNNWGCVSFDNVITYYTEIPEGIEAIDTRYTLMNGSFENGLDGWQMSITEPGVHNTLGWVQNTEIDAEWYTKNDETKDGDSLFTFVTPEDQNCESSKGTLRSASFYLKKNAYIAFRFGAAGGGENHDVYIELCRADGTAIAAFYNDAEGKVNTKMNAYYYQYTGEECECYIRVVDNAGSDYGCFVVDDFRVNLDTAPDGFIAAIQ